MIMIYLECKPPCTSSNAVSAYDPEITSAKTTEKNLAIYRLYPVAEESTIMNISICVFKSLNLRHLRFLR